MILFSTIAFAVFGLLRMRQRLEFLKSMRNALLRISSRISFSCVPLCTICEELSTEKYTGAFFGRLAEGLKQNLPIDKLWHDCLENNICEKDEIRIFLPIGSCLGMPDKAMQLKTLEAAARECEAAETRLLERIEKYKSADIKVMILCGLMTVILLI